MQHLSNQWAVKPLVVTFHSAVCWGEGTHCLPSLQIHTGDYWYNYVCLCLSHCILCCMFMFMCACVCHSTLKWVITKREPLSLKPRTDYLKSHYYHNLATMSDFEVCNGFAKLWNLWPSGWSRSIPLIDVLFLHLESGQICAWSRSFWAETWMLCVLFNIVFWSCLECKSSWRFYMYNTVCISGHTLKK